MLRLATAGLVLVACTLTLSAQGGASPDVIVGGLIDTQNWGTSGNITAYSVGTESCNIGNQNLTWIATNNLHPVIAQNLYRLKNGRFEQLGMSWLKNGFYALSNNLCSPCQTGSPNGTWLGIGCSDPYGAGLNGSQGNLSPRYEVNPVTGYFPYPGANPPTPNPLIGQRIQVAVNDMNPAMNAGALYFVEGHYIHPEDAAANNRNNNASWREVTVTPTVPYNLNFTGGSLASYPTHPMGTHRMEPAIYAWKHVDPTVQIQVLDIPGDGRILIAFKGTPTATPNIYHYEFAVQNLNSDRSIGSFSIEHVAGREPDQHVVPRRRASLGRAVRHQRLGCRQHAGRSLPGQPHLVHPDATRSTPTRTRSAGAASSTSRSTAISFRATSPSASSSRRPGPRPRRPSRPLRSALLSARRPARPRPMRSDQRSLRLREHHRHRLERPLRRRQRHGGPDRLHVPVLRRHAHQRRDLDERLPRPALDRRRHAIRERLAPRRHSPQRHDRDLLG